MNDPKINDDTTTVNPMIFAIRTELVSRLYACVHQHLVVVAVIVDRAIKMEKEVASPDRSRNEEKKTEKKKTKSVKIKEKNKRTS